MAHTAHFSQAAHNFANALLELATEQQQETAIAQDLRDLRQVLDSNPVFREFLADPGISEEERGGVVKRLFDGKVSPLLMHFLGVLNVKGRLGILPEISGAYDEALEEQQGKVEVDVTVAHRLSAEQLEQVRARVSTALKRDAVVHQYVDESIIGGLLLRVQDQLIDASVRNQLQAMKQQLLAARPAGKANF
ncbi:MAG TPA: ATP synthase F1 subunit delta [Tepidisphaeraceae bacterium]